MNDDLINRIAEAAHLRASGLSSDAVAKEVGRSPETCRQWPIRFEKEWQRFYRFADEGLDAEAASETRFYMRKLLRSNDPTYCLKAAQTLLKHRADLLRAARPTAEKKVPSGSKETEGTSNESLAIAKAIDKMSEAEMRQHIERFTHIVFPGRLLPEPQAPKEDGSAAPPDVDENGDTTKRE